jgi:ATP-dependent Clp protease ATP-binding subunit ClpC
VSGERIEAAADETDTHQTPPNAKKQRKKQNNPILLGDPGVGKTAIAEGLAYCIVHGTAPFSLSGGAGTTSSSNDDSADDGGPSSGGAAAGSGGGGPLPAFLRDKRVLQLDVGLLIAGAKERGELESRVTRLMQEIRESGGNVILM